MKYYQMDFRAAPADEGEMFKYKIFTPCPYCGLSFVPFSYQFLVPEDTVDIFDVALWDPIEHPIFEAAGLLVAESGFANYLVSVGLTGINLEEATVSLINNDFELPSYKWVQVIGRCKTNDIWSRVISVCSHCQTEKTERVVSPVRTVFLKSPPKFDLSRSREREVGIVVSDRFVEVLRQKDPNFSEFIEFKNLEVKEGDL